jgi:transposase-like protein
MSMKPISKSRGNGVTSLVPSIGTGIGRASMLSEKRTRDAAQCFFKQALQTVGHAPDLVTTDGQGSSPRALRETFGGDVLHQANHSLNKIIVASAQR